MKLWPRLHKHAIAISSDSKELTIITMIIDLTSTLGHLYDELHKLRTKGCRLPLVMVCAKKAVSSEKR